ncbi:hypothetical protein TNCV_2517331 [Trichonephila clavipes]|nr:hypothetical protein TNCV_2517331 [Trichonephila clavipes]
MERPGYKRISLSSIPQTIPPETKILGAEPVSGEGKCNSSEPFSTVTPNSNPTIVMLQAKAGFVSKHNIGPFRCPCLSFITPVTRKRVWFPLKYKRSNCGH